MFPSPPFGFPINDNLLTVMQCVVVYSTFARLTVSPFWRLSVSPLEKRLMARHQCPRDVCALGQP